MLWFFIVLVITILAFLFIKKLDEFGTAVFAIGIVVLAIMSVLGIIANTDTDAYIASMQQKHEMLVYQLENNVYANNNDIGMRELYEDIQEWNEDLAMYKELQDSVWVGMFYANVYDQFEFIPLVGDQ